MKFPRQPDEKRRFRTLVTNVDPDAVYVAVREAGGYRSWEDPSRDLHCVASTLVETFQSGGSWVLSINGPTVDAVRECLRQLRLGADRAVQEVADRSSSANAESSTALSSPSRR